MNAPTQAAILQTLEQDPYLAVEAAYRSAHKKLGHEYFVIDCDRHIIEPPEAFTMFLDAEWQHMAPKPVTDNTGAPRLMIEGRLYQKPSGWGSGRTEGCGDQRPRGEGLSYEHAHRHAFEHRDTDMDLSGIDCAVWIPTLGLFTPDIQNLDFQYAVMRALNDWTAKVWATGKRHFWCATIPLKPEWAVQEIRRCHALGARCVWMRPNVMQGVRWWGEDWDPVWNVMAELGMPLVFHEATGTYNATCSTDYKFDRYWVAHAVSHPLEMAAALAGILGYGVLERHPGLRVLFCEAGASWVPYMLFRLDSHFESRRQEMAGLTMPLSEYFKRQCVICSFEPEEALLRETMQWFGGRNMGCTSDYPHWDSSGVSGVVRYLKNYPELDEATRVSFFSRAAIDALGLHA
jgi:predicted TIM-barrel fold metal-dependent hydrolase